MRQYEPIWENIKLNLSCEISAHKAYHRRIIKAVTKEKDIDLGYKLQLSESYPPKHALLYSKSKGSIIKFTLKINIAAKTLKHYHQNLTIKDI